MIFIIFFFFYRLLNHVMKRGSSSANTLGVIAVMYSAFGTILEKSRGVEDEVNTMVSATATGMIFRSTCKFHLIIFLTFSKEAIIFS